MEVEICKPVVGYEGLYEISNKGRVRNTKRNKLVVDRTQRKYSKVSLYKNGVHKDFLIHRLVAEAFIPNPDNLPCVNHRDENTKNNCAENLEWCTYKYNNNYGTHLEKLSKNNMNNSKLSKPVAQYTREGVLVAIYPSLGEASRQNGFSSIFISCCCRKIKSYNTAYGYKWKYLD